MNDKLFNFIIQNEIKKYYFIQWILKLLNFIISEVKLIYY